MFKFYKYQSLGNDFILFDTAFPLELIQGVCDRHFGIGADGVLMVKDNHCVMYNPDGTLGEKCLNGLRCVALHLYKQTPPQKYTLYRRSPSPDGPW